MKSYDNTRLRRSQRLTKRKALYYSTPIKKSKSASTNRENGCHTRNMTDELDISTTSSIEQRKITIIKLPSYIVNSHPLTKIPDGDISKKYNIQLKSAENENLYVTNHYDLLQIMTQYIYYRKLCEWIKEELKKTRLELLEFARNALITARDANMYTLQNISDSNLTNGEKDFIHKYAEISSLDSYLSSNNPKYLTYQFNQSGNETTAAHSCHKQDQPLKIDFPPVTIEEKENEDQPEKHDHCHHKIMNCEMEKEMAKEKDEVKCHDEGNTLYLCDKCSSGRQKVDKGVNSDNGTCVKADTCTCNNNSTQNAGCCTII